MVNPEDRFYTLFSLSILGAYTFGALNTKNYANFSSWLNSYFFGSCFAFGSEFVNFVATLATCRMLRKAGRAGLLDKMSYAELLDDLSSAWRRVDAPSDPSTGDGFLVHTLKTVFEELEALGLSKPIPELEPKKRGRELTPKEGGEQKKPSAPLVAHANSGLQAKPFYSPADWETFNRREKRKPLEKPSLAHELHKVLVFYAVFLLQQKVGGQQIFRVVVADRKERTVLPIHDL